MIQPISYSNTNFRGQMQVSMKNNSSKGIDEILSKLPEGEEKEMFQKTIDSFQKEIEEKTPDDASFVLEMTYDDWFAGGVLKSGKSVIFDVRDLNDSTGKKLFKGEMPITRSNGNLWKEGKSFKKDIEKFFKGASETVINNFRFRQAVEDARKPKTSPKKSLLDEIS